MIRHVVRQERKGGYWMIREQGCVLTLGQAGYSLFEVLAENRRDKLASALREVERETPDLIQPLREQILTDNSEAENGIRLVPCRNLLRLPKDAVAAPKRIYFELTRSCNLSCRSCFNNSRHPMRDELSLDEVLEVNRQAWEMGVFEIRYTGGECTTLPWFPQVIDDARQRGFYISLGSNGVYSEEILQWIAHSGIDWLIISLDGDRETNDRVRGRGTYERVIHTLAYLANHSRMRVRLNVVVARHNIDHLASIAEVAERYGVESINLIPLRPYGRSLKHMVRDMFGQQDFFDFIQKINLLRQTFKGVAFSTTIDLLDPEATTSHDLMVEKKQTCAAGVEACVIGPRGDVYGCSYSPASFPDSRDLSGRKVFVAGNLRRDDLQTIWRDSERWTVFRDVQSYKHPKCHRCEHYTVRCSGSCPIMAWYALGEHGDATPDDISQVCDPYCFADLVGGERP